jgi:hypothetical protein
VKGRRKGRRKQLLDDFKKTTYCELKEEAQVRTLWITHFGRGYGPVVRYPRINELPKARHSACK